MESEGGIEKKFKLTSSISANNMVLFDHQSRIRKFQDEVEILNEYFPVRLNIYRKRKAHQLKVMRKDLTLMENKCRFIEGVNSGDIILREQTKANIVSQLTKMNFATDAEVLSKNERNESDGASFDYLLNMALYSLTKEKVQELKNKIGDKKTQIEKLER